MLQNTASGLHLQEKPVRPHFLWHTRQRVELGGLLGGEEVAPGEVGSTAAAAAAAAADEGTAELGKGKVLAVGTGEDEEGGGAVIDASCW